MGVKKRNRTGTPTLTRVRIVMVDSNATFAGVISTVFLAAVRISMLVFNAVAVAELDSGLGVGSPTAQGLEVDMLRDCGDEVDGGLRAGSWAALFTRAYMLRSAQDNSSEHLGDTKLKRLDIIGLTRRSGGIDQKATWGEDQRKSAETRASFGPDTFPDTLFTLSQSPWVNSVRIPPPSNSPRFLTSISRPYAPSMA